MSREPAEARLAVGNETSTGEHGGMAYARGVLQQV